jgi:hypothetical protein
MSIFDKFLNTNPYVRTYVGAPIQEAVQAASALQQRHDKALTDMQQHEFALQQISGVSAADKAYKDQYAAELAQEFDKLREAPEMAQQAIDSLAAKYKNDPTLRNMQQYAAKKAEWEKKFEENPEQFGPAARYEMMQAIKQYEQAGGAQKAVFKAPALYERQDVNQFLRDNADAINASSNGEFTYDPVHGTIVTTSGEQISFERAQQVLNNALMADPKMRRQMQAEFNYMSAPLSEGGAGFKGNYSDFINQTTQGTAYATAYSKTERDAKNWSNAPDGSGGGGDFDFGFAVGEDRIVETAPKVKDLNSLRAGRAERGDNAADARLTAEEDRLWNSALANTEMDSRVRSALTNMGIDGIPYRETNMTVATGGRPSLGIDGGAGRWAMQATGDGGKISAVDTDALREYYRGTGASDKQVEELVTKTKAALNGVFGDNMIDNMNDARKVAYQTAWATPENELGQMKGGEKKIGALNSLVDVMITSMPSITGAVNGEPTEFKQGEIQEQYQSFEVAAWDTRGSGQLKIKAKRADGTGFDMINVAGTQEGESARQLADFWRNLEGMELAKARNAKMGSPAYRKHTANALAIAQPRLIEQVQFLDSQNDGVNYSDPANFARLQFGDLDYAIQDEFGQLSLGKDENGRYIVTQPGGKNFFENNEAARNMIKNSSNARQAMAGLMQFFQAQLGG